MDQVQVCIVGAGPSGLVLALSLAKFKIRSVILEKESEITEDPRGVYLTPDACRILWDLGIGRDMVKIGHAVPSVNFHKSSFANPPFHSMDTSEDDLKQAIPNGILQMQPKLERALRDAVANSQYCALRCACEVTGREELEDGAVVDYLDPTRSHQRLQAAWLIGADGKRGIVRKHFLEPTAGIHQVDAAYQYEGVWVAANLRITSPTPTSHPEFPLWKLGYTPDQVYDFFWPRGWHFASPPGKATASGQFGPYEERLWRHEFEQSDWDDSMNAEELLWEHITPMITRSTDIAGRMFDHGPVEFPRDCIEVLRCRPFKFAHKIVNQWFRGKTILIGDAAHVFPPFGGQGIASGVRDAHQLAWRLAILTRLPDTDRNFCDRVLAAWANERTHSVRDAAYLTQINGDICNGIEPLSSRLLRWSFSVMKALPFLTVPAGPIEAVEERGFSRLKHAHIDSAAGGGIRVSQVWVSQTSGSPILSDALFRHSFSVMTLLVIGDTSRSQQLVADARQIVTRANIPEAIMSPKAIVHVRSDSQQLSKEGNDVGGASYRICAAEEVRRHGHDVVKGYDERSFLRRLGGAQYAIVRPDFYIFARLASLNELERCLAGMALMLSSGDNGMLSHRL